MRSDTGSAIVLGVAVLLAAAPHDASAQRAPVATWTLAPSPTWSAGGASDSTELSRVAWVVPSPSSGTFVYDRDARAFRLYSPAGTLLSTFGRNGRGPGELQLPGYAGVWRDTLFVADPVQARLSKFTTSGVYLTSSPLPVELLTRFHLAGRLVDGSWVLRTSETSRQQLGRHGVFRDDVEVMVTTELQVPVGAPVARTKGAAILYRSTGRGPQASVTMSQAALGAAGFVVSGSRTIWVGDGATDSLVAWSPAGRRLASVRVPWPAQRVTAERVRREKARWRARSSNAQWQAAIDESFASENLPSSLPRVGAALVDEAGRLWVGSFASSPRDAIEYAIFDETGRPLARLDPPPGIRIVAAGDDWALVIHTDEDELQSLRHFRLRQR